MSRLLACPFCRELFDRSEAEHCPECDIALTPMHRLPPSLEEVEREAVEWERTAPEDVPVRWYELGHGRGPLLLVAALGLLAFGLPPWVHISAPYDALRSGSSLANGPLGWLWGGAVAWAMIVALVLSRRTPRQMQGVRGITMLFAATTASEIAMLLFTSPKASGAVRFEYDWEWGLYVSLACSVAGVFFGWRFGISRTRASEEPRTRSIPASSDSSTVH